MRLNKDLIRLRFAGAGATYEGEAVIQLKVADRLMALLEEHVASPPQRILEIGACTGLLTSRLHEQFPTADTIYVNDLVPDFQAGIAERLHHDPRLVYVAGDIEQLDLPPDLDLVVSSSTLHWLEDLPAFLQKINTCLRPGGIFCFSIYGIGNLSELREITGIGLDYYDRDGLQNLVGQTFDILACSEERITLHFDDPLTLLNHLRDTGVNALDATPWTRTRLNRFRRQYKERFESQGQVPLTYHPIYCFAMKNS